MSGPLEVELRGLNLTRATLNGMLKYPYPKSDPDKSREKFGFYDEDITHFHFARQGSPRLVNGDRRKACRQRSIEAEIMDWADDIAYSIHDLEDFYRAKVIPFSMLGESSGEQERFRRSFRQRDRLPDDEHTDAALKELFFVIAAKLRQPFDGTRLARANLREVAIDLTAKFMRAFALTTPRSENQWALAEVAPGARALAEVLKHLMWHYLIERPTLATIQDGHRTIVRELLEYYSAAIKPRMCDERLPITHQLELRKAGGDELQRARVVIDFVAGMTEPQATAIHRRIAGLGSDSVLAPFAEL